MFSFFSLYNLDTISCMSINLVVNNKMKILKLKWSIIVIILINFQVEHLMFNNSFPNLVK